MASAHFIAHQLHIYSLISLFRTLLKALGCLNPVKREKASSVKAIAILAKNCSLSWMSVLFKMSGQFMLSMKMLSSYTKRNALTIFGKKCSISNLLMGLSLDMSLFQK